MEKSPVYIAAARRSPFGRLYGSLASWRADDLMAFLCRKQLNHFPRADGFYLGAANQAGEDSRNIARQVALLADMGFDVPALSLNSLCSSGLDALIAAARCLALGEGHCYYAGAVESMSRAPWIEHRQSKERADSTIGWRFVNPNIYKHYQPHSMVETIETLCQKQGLSRSEQDHYAHESRKRYARALALGHWKQEIEALPLDSGQLLDFDEQHRELELELLGKLRPLKAGAKHVSIGNSSRAGDGAGLLILCSEQGLAGKQALARIVDWAEAALHPDDMGIAAVPAIEKLLEKQKLKVEDIGHWELSESFAAQPLLTAKALDIKPEKINRAGGSLSMGNPTSLSALRLLISLVYMPNYTGKKARYGIAAAAAGLGIGKAVLVEYPPFS